MPPSPQATAELFQLVFVRGLVARGEAKGQFAVKGGCNLRFFFGSPRHSEDIDLDVVVMGKETLRNRVERLLRSNAITSPLNARGIEVVELSAPKHAETTQRWKVALQARGSSVVVRSRVEFSRRRDPRAGLAGSVYEAPEPELLRHHGLSPFLAPHYGLAAAIGQKVAALAGRSEPQARDVFDLDHLFSRPDARGAPRAAPPIDDAQRTAAIERAMTIGYDEYAAQVLAFLDPEQVGVYADRPAWHAMVERVVAGLEGTA